MKIQTLEGHGDNGSSEMTIPNGKWVCFADTFSGWYPRSEDRRQSSGGKCKPLVVLNTRLVRVIGSDEQCVKKISYQVDFDDQCAQNRTRYHKYCLVSDQPFGSISVQSTPNITSHHTIYHFESARQVHKGEVGQKIPLRYQPNVVASNFDLPDYHGSKKRCINWVSLGEISENLGVDPCEVIQHFAGLSPSSIYAPNVPIILGNNPKSATDTDRYRVYLEPVTGNRCMHETKWHGEILTLDRLRQSSKEVWIPQGFAQTILRIHQLSGKPDSANFTVMADVPEQPTNTLPDLPVEELTDYRRGLSPEATRAEFEAAAEAALPKSTWQEARHMDDRSEGFSYYTNFRRLEAFDGRLQVSLCHATTPVTSSSRNHWAAIITVHERRPNNPRVDDAKLRIWIWPGQLLRQTPSGSIGGLCRSLQEPGIVNKVTKIVKYLGYRDLD